MKTLLPLLTLLLLSACVVQRTPVMNYVDVSDVDWTQVTSMRSGQDCSWYFLGALPLSGSASMVQAVSRAGISKLHVADYKTSSFLLVSKRCIVVYGE